LVGGLFALYEAYSKWQDPHPIEGQRRWVPLAVLAGAILAEGFSFRTAMRESNRTRGRKSWVEFVRTAKAPELPGVLLEDFGALLGLLFALFGVSLITGNGAWDAAGTAMIGLLPVAIAAVLAVETNRCSWGNQPPRTTPAASRRPSPRTEPGSSTSRRCTWGPRNCWWPQRFPLTGMKRVRVLPEPSTQRRSGSGKRFLLCG